MKKAKILTLTLLIGSLFILLPSHNSKSEAYVSFTFDDSYSNLYANALPIFRDAGACATAYAITDRAGTYFEDTRLMEISEIKELKDSCWEIGSHTSTHPYLTASENLGYELSQSKSYLEENGIEAESLSIPYGAYNDNVINESKKHYTSVRTSDWGTNDLNSLDPYRLKSMYVKNTTTAEEIKSWIDNAKKDRVWLIILLHHVSDNKTGEYTITPGDLRDIVEYTKKEGIKIKTIKEVISTWKKP